jgi:lysyl endopeptidase
MAKRLLMLAPLVLFYSCAGDPGQDAAPIEATPGVVEASAWVPDDDPGTEAAEEVSTPGLEQRLYAIPETATVIPAKLTEQAMATALERRDDIAKRHLASVHVPVDSLPAPRWERIDGGSGSSWRLAIVSEGASFVRPHFVGFPGKDEAQVVVYGGSSDQRASVARPTARVTGRDFWGPVVEGSVLFVEVVTASGAEPSLRVDVVSNGVPQVRASVGSCYLDPTCYSSYNSIKSGIGLLYFEEGPNGYVCSGSMVADKAHSGKPYFLTAHHCISTQSVADSSIVFWNYGTSSCGGSVPSLESRPRTQGSSVKATSSSSDFTLLLLDHKPPSGTKYLGWTTSALSTNAPITVIHHPAGTFKRITFGKVTQTSGNFWRVVYSESSTEGGSSGSPLLNSSKQIVGQLYAGTASCTNTSGYDKFGKFGVSWTKGLSTYLNN